MTSLSRDYYSIVPFADIENLDHMKRGEHVSMIAVNLILMFRTVVCTFRFPYNRCRSLGRELPIDWGNLSGLVGSGPAGSVMVLLCKTSYGANGMTDEQTRNAPTRGSSLPMVLDILSRSEAIPIQKKRLTTSLMRSGG